MDSVSAIRPFAAGLGLLAGPILDGFLTKYIGFAHMSKVLSLVFLIFRLSEFVTILSKKKEEAQQWQRRQMIEGID